MWLADVACSVMIIVITATLRTDALISQQKLLKPFLYSFFCITIALNFLTTGAYLTRLLILCIPDFHPGFIVWKIRGINKETASHVTQRTTHKVPRTRLEQAIRIIIESGMLYTVFVILTFATALAGSNAIYGVSDMVCFLLLSQLSTRLISTTFHPAGCRCRDLVQPHHHPRRPDDYYSQLVFRGVCRYPEVVPAALHACEWW